MILGWKETHIKNLTKFENVLTFIKLFNSFNLKIEKMNDETKNGWDDVKTLNLKISIDLFISKQSQINNIIVPIDFYFSFRWIKGQDVLG